MSQLALVASAMSSILNIPVKTYDECVANGYNVSSEQILDINFIHRNSLMRFGQEVKKSEDTLFTQKSSIGIQIFVKNLFGESQAMFVNPQNTVLELKHVIQEKFDYDIRLIRLEFANKRLEDNRTLKSYNIKQGDNLHISLRLLGGNFDMEYCVINNFCVIEKNLLDPSYDFDFTHLRDEGETHIRGNHLYKRPYGWNRIALNVKKYNFDPDYKWLGHVGNSPHEWAVSYHGTEKDNVNSIADNGYLLEKGIRFKFGRGIYSTPEVHTAEKYAADFEYDGEKYKVVFQNRVNTVGLDKCKDGNYTYWLTPKEKDIIPYGLCTKKINSYCASS